MAIMAQASACMLQALSHASSEPAHSPVSSAASQGPCLAWFDAVLADIGDSQDLQQSLSTFSGHVRRVDGILRAAGPHSLVLLDEVHSLPGGCSHWDFMAV